MQELQQRILQDGDILPGGVVRVERFLNHRVDTALACHIGQAFADAFRNDQIDCILTVEASGIIFAMTTALAMGELPVIIAKTQYSFSDDPKKLGAPEGFTLTIRSVRVSAGAGFVVALSGDIMTMPGLPKVPAAVNIDVTDDGKITGLF